MDPIKDAVTRPGGIAARLRALRAQAGLAAKDIAEATGWHPSKVSRLENGRQTPSPEDIRTWARVTRTDEVEARAILQILDEARAEHHDWKLNMRRGQAEVQADYNQLAAESHLIRHFEMTAIPGLLQTPAYARVMFQEMVELHDLEVDDVEAAIATRMRRQQFLYDPGKRFEFLLAEPVLRWLLCPPDVMRGQLDRLQTVIDVPNVRFGIVPLGVELSAIPQNTVVLYVGRETVAAVETFIAETLYRGEQAEAFAAAVDRLWSDAVVGDQARGLIIAAMRDLPH